MVSGRTLTETVRLYWAQCTGRVGERYIKEPHRFTREEPAEEGVEYVCRECREQAKELDYASEIRRYRNRLPFRLS